MAICVWRRALGAAAAWPTVIAACIEVARWWAPARDGLHLNRDLHVPGGLAAWDEANAALEQALAIATQLGDHRLTGESLTGVGIDQHLQGNFEEGRQAVQ